MKHRIVTAAQMKEIERAGDAHGLPYLQMMENAGLAAYAELQKQFPHPGRLLVVCGKGNNGGDGFVIARAAAKDGWKVTVLLAEGEPKTPDAITNFERLHGLPVEICTGGSGLSAGLIDTALQCGGRAILHNRPQEQLQKFRLLLCHDTSICFFRIPLHQRTGIALCPFKETWFHQHTIIGNGRHQHCHVYRRHKRISLTDSRHHLLQML